ncbi:MAG: hypothetical protein LC130_25580 [Bryobacterales bacterium]|nr:hypothetical protein [Bryobacterales bacterium]
MRYPKGGVDLSSSQDTFLLQQVLRSRHVSHEQLWEFMQYKAREHRRRVFNWRVKRLVDHELLLRRAVPNWSWVYWLSPDGADHLVGLGDAAALLVTGGFVERDHGSVQHSLELNDLHLALLRSGVAANWQSELEIRSLNEFTAYGFSKDYDAVVRVDFNGGPRQFALEYERSPKTPEKYARVRQALERERHVECFLYILPAYPLLSYVASFFERRKVPVYFALLDEFRKRALETEVMDSRRLQTVPLCTLLNAGLRRETAGGPALPSH